MSIFQYVEKMQDLGTTTALIGLGIVALFLCIIIFKMLGGLFRGTLRQLLRTGFTLLSAIIAYCIAVSLSNNIIGMLNANNLEGVISAIDSYVPGLGDALRSAVGSFDGELLEYLLLLPATIFIIPCLTPVIFMLINLVLKIVRAILTKVLGIERGKGAMNRLGGAALAAVEGIIWMVVIMLPICSIMSIVDESYNDAIKAADGDVKIQLEETYDEYFLPFTANPAVNFISSVGADAMADGIATVKIDNKKFNVREQVLDVAHIVIVDTATLKGADFTALNEEQKEAFGSIIDTLGDSPLLSRILVNVLHAIPSVYEKGLISLDLSSSEYTAVVDNLIIFLETTNDKTIGKDLDTIKDFYFGFCDSGLAAAIKNGEDIVKFINDDYKGEKHILGMINSLSGNPRTQGIVDGLYNLVLNVAFSGAMDKGEGDTAIDINISDVKEGLNNIVSVKKDNYATEEEYKEELSNTIGSTLNDTMGVELEKEVVDDIADYVDQNYSEKLDDLTDEEFNELIFEFIDIYQGYLNGEEVNPDDLNNIIPGGNN